MTKQTQITSADLNQMVVGLTGRAGSIENQLIAALMLYKTTANELQKQVNENTVDYGVGQGEAEKAFYNSQSESDKMSGGMVIGQAGTDLVATGIGEFKAGRQTVEGSGNDGPTPLDKDTEKQNKTIDECNKKEKTLNSNTNNPAVATTAGAARTSATTTEASSEKTAPGQTDKEKAEALKENAQTRKEAQKKIKDNVRRRSDMVQHYQRYGDMAGKALQAADKFQSSVQSKAQGEHKQEEITNQMSNQINQNVWKGFDTQKDTVSSEITSTISTFGSQGLGQANLHRPV